MHFVYRRHMDAMDVDEWLLQGMDIVTNMDMHMLWILLKAMAVD